MPRGSRASGGLPSSGHRRRVHPGHPFYSVVGATALEASGWVMLFVMGVSIVPLFFLFFFRRRILAWSYRRERRLRDLAKAKLGREGTPEE
jgi:hypothetical protein